MQELRRSNQHGFGLLVIVALLGVFVATALVTVARGATSTTARMAQSQQALAIAKQALLDYAAAAQLDPNCAYTNSTTCARIGELPCPDLNNDGLADGPCNTTTTLLGRLPWKTLGLPDLRDADGERLWYAVSLSFVNNPRNSPCGLPEDSGCLNSNTKGQITVRTFSGSAAVKTNDAGAGTGAVAVIIAPGAILTRPATVSPATAAVQQNRSCAGDSSIANCQATAVCTGPVYTNTALCNPINYLDLMGLPLKAVAGGVNSKEDNAGFTLNVSSDGFLNGPILDTTGVVRFNDIVLPVTVTDVMAAAQRRVAQEVLSCLKSYANPTAYNLPNTYGYGRYPWAANASPWGTSQVQFYPDVSGNRFGHIPDSTQLSNTYNDSANGPYTAGQIPAPMSATWPPAPSCNLGPASAWWMNWKDLVYYGVAQGYEPDVNIIGCTGSNCLTVSPISGNDKQITVVVAGTRINGQVPITSTQCNVVSPPLQCNNLANYLEGGNITSSSTLTYQVGTPSPTFNDVVVYQ